ncbi:MAG: FmdB family zinc ribbon protein [Planctomycetota bacterium]|jgi:putative FmdB family regulatory protein
MPTYEYRCKSCGHVLELFQSIKDRPVKKCPSCEARTLERLIGAGAGIIFKGSGFYETDYRSASYKADARKDHDTPSSSSTASDSSKKTSSKKPAADSKKMKAAG